MVDIRIERNVLHGIIGLFKLVGKMTSHARDLNPAQLKQEYFQ